MTEGIRHIKQAIRDAEKWLEKEAHKSGKETPDNLTALRSKIDDLNKSIRHLENSGSSTISDKEKLAEHNVCEVNDNASILDDKIMRKIIHLLKSYPDGLTIAGIIKKLNLSRHTVLARLHVLDGKNLVRVRKINMAKLHFWNAPADKDEEEIQVVPIREDNSSIKKESFERELPVDIEKLKVEIRAELRNELMGG
ncbi:MAG: hypothetical protein AABW88_02200, partial [Nanoarchaeota archaeon]